MQPGVSDTVPGLGPPCRFGRWRCPGGPCAPISNDPGVGGFGQLDAEIVLQNPVRIYGMLAFFASGGHCPDSLVAEEKQVEKGSGQPRAFDFQPSVFLRRSTHEINAPDLPIAMFPFSVPPSSGLGSWFTGGWYGPAVRLARVVGLVLATRPSGRSPRHRSGGDCRSACDPVLGRRTRSFAIYYVRMEVAPVPAQLVRCLGELARAAFAIPWGLIGGTLAVIVLLPWRKLPVWNLPAIVLVLRSPWARRSAAGAISSIPRLLACPPILPWKLVSIPAIIGRRRSSMRLSSHPTLPLRFRSGTWRVSGPVADVFSTGVSGKISLPIGALSCPPI